MSHPGSVNGPARAKGRTHVVVLGNEKGGTGKSTTAMHLIIGAMREGARVGSIDLDSVEYQEGDWGGQIRLALKDRFSVKTIPQIFVGGQHVGGATEVFDAQKSGELHSRLAANDVSYNESVDVDPYSFLPGWLQTR